MESPAISTFTGRARTSRCRTGPRRSSRSARLKVTGPPGAGWSRYSIATARERATCSRFGSVTRSSSARPAGSPRSRGKRESRARSPGTDRTARAGWGGSTGWGDRRFERSPVDRAREVATLNPMKTVVTGGAGFLGTHLVERLRAQGIEPYVPHLEDWHLTRERDVERLFAETSPELLIHLAAEVGGIGANQPH